MWKAIAIVALTLGLEAGFLLNAAIPARPARPDSAEVQQAELLARARAEQACEVARLQARAARPDRS
jgi:hypothetical protein